MCNWFCTLVYLPNYLYLGSFCTYSKTFMYTDMNLVVYAKRVCLGGSVREWYLSAYVSE